MTAELSKAYDPAEVENRLYTWWEERGLFDANAADEGEPFAVMLPLPNITGSLHIGHALDHSVQDAIIRRARMQGFNTLWQPGTDHAGIATQNVVEKELAKDGVSRHDLGREAFVERVWQWREASGETILRQMRRLGTSCDWRRSVFTLDEHYQHAVRETFVTLFEQDLIYRGYRLINWCPRDMSAISDIEVDHVEEMGELAFIRYPTSDGGEGVVVATTRVETMLGDTAVAVHPDDERYHALIGTTLRLPLMDRDIPVIADEHVDPEFGTGAVKVTPAHDPNDYEIGQRHSLESIDVMTDEARINISGGAYAGLDRFEARVKIKEDLDQLGLLVRVEERLHSVGHCSRCSTIVEPRLSDQWFVAVETLAQRAAEAVRTGRTTFVPTRNAKTFLAWLDNLHDWCISRQLWWGHRIPAWYADDGEILVLREDPTPEQIEARGLRQDPDVLDTWFSSQIWPFTTLGWPDETPDLERWYPTSVLVTGYDINTFWVSRMLMMGLHLLDEVPFSTVLNHGLVRDQFGKKMSKSFGNVIDPLDLIDRYGADALRFSLFRAAAPGQDVPLAEEWVKGARNFANKLWNAGRFVLTRLPGGVASPADPATLELEAEDRWILSRLETARAAAEEAYACFDLARVAQTLYHFLWDEFCDWYLELVKLRDDEAVPAVLTAVLDVALRLLHPLMPFVTEELWRTMQGGGEVTLVRAAWPEALPERRDPDAEAAVEVVQEAVTALRRFRADHTLPHSTRIDVTAVTDAAQQELLQAGLPAIQRLGGTASWTFAADAVQAQPVGKVVISGGELFIPLAGLIDLDEERDRLQRELDKARDEVRRAESKLANDGFVSKAPEHVVTAEREKVDDWRVQIEKLQVQLGELA